MGKTLKNKKMALAAAILIAVVAVVIGAVRIQKGVAESQKKDSQAQSYMEASADYIRDFDELPADIESWRAWRSLGGPGYVDNVLWDTEELQGGLGLMNTYEQLMKINIASPGNSQCRELFEKLTPYFEKAFVWSEDTAAQQCRDRLAGLHASEERKDLCAQVGELYTAVEVDRWFILATGGDLQMLPEEYTTSSGDLQTEP